MAVDVKRAAPETPTRASVCLALMPGAMNGATTVRNLARRSPAHACCRGHFSGPLQKLADIANSFSAGANVARTSACRLPRAGLNRFKFNVLKTKTAYTTVVSQVTRRQRFECTGSSLPASPPDDCPLPGDAEPVYTRQTRSKRGKRGQTLAAKRRRYRGVAVESLTCVPV
jgi:hypothetical protein